MENTRFIRLEATRYPITSHHERHRSDTFGYAAGSRLSESGLPRTDI